MCGEGEDVLTSIVKFLLMDLTPHLTPFPTLEGNRRKERPARLFLQA